MIVVSNGFILRAVRLYTVMSAVKPVECGVARVNLYHLKELRATSYDQMTRRKRSIRKNMRRIVPETHSINSHMYMYTYMNDVPVCVEWR